MELHNGLTPEQIVNLEAKELEYLLQTELQKQTDAIDTSLVQLLLKELVIRGKDPNLEDNAAVEQACEKFWQKTRKSQRGRFSWYQSWIVKAASVVLVLGILFFSLPGIAEANTIQDILTYWTDSMFRFFSPGEVPIISENYVFKTDIPSLQQIYDAVVDIGITDPVVPMWIPDGFELHDLQVFNFTEDKILYAGLRKKEKNILLSIIVHDEEVKYRYEKDNQNVEIIEVRDISHYVISNNVGHTITWWTDELECSIVTDCQEDEIYKLLFSIYVPED